MRILLRRGHIPAFARRRGARPPQRMQRHPGPATPWLFQMQSMAPGPVPTDLNRRNNKTRPKDLYKTGINRRKMPLASSQVPSVGQQHPAYAPYCRGTSRGLISAGSTDHGVVSSLEAELGSVGRQVDADAHGQPLPVLKAGHALKRQLFAHDVDVWVAGLLPGTANRGVSCTRPAQSMIGCHSWAVVGMQRRVCGCKINCARRH